MNKTITIMLLALLAVSCDKEPKFKVEGNVDGGDGKSLVLSKADFAGRWIDIDSVRVGNDGSFSIAVASPASPEIFRLSLGDRYIYIPVDSVETITLSTTAGNYGRSFKLSGTPDAERMTEFETEVMNVNMSDSVALCNFKRTVYTKYIQNSQGSIMSYYVLTKIKDGKPLFDAANASDAKYYAAVATQFDQFKPEDPHGKMVKEASLNAMRRQNALKGKQRVVEAAEIAALDIELPDVSGKNVKLSDMLGKGKPVAVIFSMMNEKESPLLNRELAGIYNRAGGRVAFYHVSLDKDAYAWRDAAKNLPWTNVLDANGLTSGAVVDYNVRTLPAFFIYSAAGELVDRAADLDDFEKKLSLY